MASKGRRLARAILSSPTLQFYSRLLMVLKTSHLEDFLPPCGVLYKYIPRGTGLASGDFDEVPHITRAGERAVVGCNGPRKFSGWDTHAQGKFEKPNMQNISPYRQSRFGPPLATRRLGKILCFAVDSVGVPGICSVENDESRVVAESGSERDYKAIPSFLPYPAGCR